MSYPSGYRVRKCANGDVVAIAGKSHLFPDSSDGLWKYRDGDSGTLYTLLTTVAAGAAYQPLDSDLTAIAALTTTSFGRSFLTLADQAAGRSYIGLGTVATLAVDLDGTMAANDDARVPSQKAVVTYVANKITGLLHFQSSTDCSANPNYPAAVKGDSYVVSVAGKIGGASGVSVDVGDVFFALADNAGGTQASVGSSWDVLEHNLVGALLSANNLSDLASASMARTNLGGTTVGQAFFTLANPSAITFPRINADNSVTAQSAASYRTDLGMGTMAVQDATAVAIAGGTIDGTPIGGTTRSTGKFTSLSANLASSINLNAASLPSPLTGTLLQVGNVDGTVSRVEVDAFGTVAFFTGVRYNGTAASPTALAANDQISGFNAWGYDGSVVAGPVATLRAFAAEAWTGSAHGAYAQIATTPVGSTTLTLNTRFEASGGFTTPTGVVIVGADIAAQQVSTSLGNVTPNVQSIALGDGSTSQATGHFGAFRYANDSGGGIISIMKSRGATAGSLGAVASGDTMGALAFHGVASDATVVRAGQVAMQVDAAPSAGVVPGRLLLQTANSSGTSTTGVYIDSNQFVGLGATPAARLHIGGNISTAAWTTNGVGLRANSVTLTDTTSSGTVSAVAMHSLAGCTLAASSSTTYTVASTLRIGAPTAGSNVTITNALGLDLLGNARLNGLVGFGTAPAAAMHLNQTISAAAWTTSGVGLRLDTNTYTDTTSSGTVANMWAHQVGAPTIAASSSTTYTDAATFNIGAGPTAGSNVTITNGYSLRTAGSIRSQGFIGVGIAPTANLHIALNNSVAAWTTSGINFRISGGTQTDTTSSGTVAEVAMNVMGQPTIAASSATTYTRASHLRVGGPPLAGTNVTITNPLALYVTTGSSRIDSMLGLGADPAAVVHIAGPITAAAWTTNGIGLRVAGSTFTDSSSSGTVASVGVSAFAAPTLAASSSATYTVAATVLIAGAPTAGSNVTITVPVALNIVAGQLRAGGGANLFGGAISLNASSNNAVSIGTGTTTGGVNICGSSNTLGFFGVTAVAKQNTTGTATGFTANAGTAANDASTFTGGSGATAYRISDIVLALKNYGLLAA